MALNRRLTAVHDRLIDQILLHPVQLNPPKVKRRYTHQGGVHSIFDVSTSK